jgi:hypothetical protein
VIQFKYQELDQGCLSSDRLKTAIDFLELTIRGSPPMDAHFLSVCLYVCIQTTPR